MTKKYLFGLIAAGAIIAGCTVNDTPDTVVTPESKPDVVVTPDTKPDVVVTPPASTTG
jgi:hypothetical protein